MYIEKITESFKKETPVEYTPVFSIKQEGNSWRIFDGDKDIALFMKCALDIWSLSPFEPDEKSNEKPPGKIVDLHTVHNTFINFGTQGWPKHWPGENAIQWKWLQDQGEKLEVEISVEGPEGEYGKWNLSVIYDPDWGRYRYLCNIDVRKMDPDRMEAFNLMTAGALEARPEKRRWTHSIWENQDGKLRRIVHSNALFMCTDFGGARHGGGPWRFRNLPYPSAWVGYAAHQSFNPIILIHKSNVPMGIATCSQLFDEHIIWNRAGQDNIGTDGYFHFNMQVEFVNLNAALAAELLEKAKDPVKPDKWHFESTALAFKMDEVNSFETPVNPWDAEECPVFDIPKCPDAPIQWVDDMGHSGSHSIRLRVTSPNEKIKLFPVGAVCNIDTNTRYRLSGWIKTEKVEDYARIELFSYAYTYMNMFDIVQSEKISGTTDWTKFEIELDSGDAAYLMPQLVLHGIGTAWFDDLQLVRV